MAAEWHCQTSGSETCLVHHGEWTVGDTFYFGVRCEQTCKYKLKIELRQVFDLPNSDRATFRFERYSTQLMRYYIPEMVKNMPIRYVKFAFESENSYERIQLFLSQSNRFDMQQERVPVHVLENGVGLMLTKKDIVWCTKCYIYLLLNIDQEDRYYATARAEGLQDDVPSNIRHEILINPF